jgi:hypothetical protein
MLAGGRLQTTWSQVTPISMASKHVQNLTQRLNIAPEKRARLKANEEPEQFDFNAHLNAN